jgi:hypothetical protein
MGDISLRHILAVIGEDATRAIEEQLGGAHIVIPKKIGLHHPIGQAIGVEAAAKLSEALAGSIIDIPVTARKRALIEGALRNSDSVNTIARRYYCSPRYVWKVKAELAAIQEPKQMGLF